MSNVLIDNDRYEFDDVDILGRGGFGVVYRGHDRRLNRPVAVKAIHPHLLADPAFANRFQQEAQTLAGLDDHPAIVNVYDVVVQDGQLYIVMACVPGQTLKQVCQSHAPLSPAQAIAILRPLAGALDFAHQRGLLHRDVKPGNVLLTADHKPVLIDFGLARALEQSTQFTRSGSTFGSPAYMAPEQVDPNRRDQVGPAADRYALGIVAYELLAGRVPFPGSDNATLYAHEHKAPPSPRQYRPNLPPAMEQAILKMLAKRPAERYATCAEFVDALEQAAQPRPSPATPAPAARPGHRVPAWLWAAGAGGLLLVVCLLGLGLRDLGGWLLAASPGPTATATNTPTITAMAIVGQPTATRTPSPTDTATATPGPEPGSTRTRDADGMTMVYVPAGSFTMGSDSGEDDEQPLHPVTLDAFWLDQTEVTNAQFVAFLNQFRDDVRIEDNELIYLRDQLVYDLICTNCETWQDRIKWNGEQFGVEADLADHPVAFVSWYGANVYCENVGGRLPTEAEWEYAARGPDSNIYPWGNEFDGTKLNFCDANCDLERKDDSVDDGYQTTAPVGSYPAGASWVGARDMAGNVWEWVADWYSSNYYQTSPAENPVGPQDGDWKVLRGGAWFDVEILPRSAVRNYNVIDLRGVYVGFRCVVPP